MIFLQLPALNSKRCHTDNKHLVNNTINAGLFCSTIQSIFPFQQSKKNMTPSMIPYHDSQYTEITIVNFNLSK